LTAEEPVVDVFCPRQPGLGASEMAFNRVDADEQIRLLGDNVPDDESRPCVDRLVKTSILSGRALLPQVLQLGSYRVALKSGDAPRRLTIRAGGPGGVAAPATTLRLLR
jgi:hypothetical protein